MLSPALNAIRYPIWSGLTPHFSITCQLTVSWSAGQPWIRRQRSKAHNKITRYHKICEEGTWRNKQYQYYQPIKLKGRKKGRTETLSQCWVYASCLPMVAYRPAGERSVTCTSLEITRNITEKCTLNLTQGENALWCPSIPSMLYPNSFHCLIVHQL